MTRIHSRLASIALVLAYTSSAAFAADPPSYDLLLPISLHPGQSEVTEAGRLHMDKGLQGLVDEMARRSPAFRRQWLRLARHPRLILKMELVPSSPVRYSDAATRIVTGADGWVTAVVAIPAGPRIVELIAHELEHILERLDGASMPERHAMGDASVRRNDGMYETSRAVRSGRVALNEYLSAR